MTIRYLLSQIVRISGVSNAVPAGISDAGQVPKKGMT